MLYLSKKTLFYTFSNFFKTFGQIANLKGGLWIRADWGAREGPVAGWLKVTDNT